MMKKIKIDFIDFWDIDKENNIITNTLRSKYDVTISKEPDYIFCSVFEILFQNSYLHFLFI